MATEPVSRLTYAPILLGVAFIATLFLVAESGYKRIHEASRVISEAEDRQALMSRYLRVMLDAESAQRGFLLTQDPRYLRGFDPAVRALEPLLDRLVLELRESGLPIRTPTGPRGYVCMRARRSARWKPRSASTARWAATRRSSS